MNGRIRLKKMQPRSSCQFNIFLQYQNKYTVNFPYSQTFHQFFLHLLQVSRTCYRISVHTDVYCETVPDHL